MRIHRRQFILGPRPVRPFPDWLTIDIPGIDYLSHCFELRTASAEPGDVQTWYVVGRVSS